MKNGMGKKAAADDAEMTVDDYVATPADNYKFMADFRTPRSRGRRRRRNRLRRRATPRLARNRQNPRRGVAGAAISPRIWSSTSRPPR